MTDVSTNPGQTLRSAICHLDAEHGRLSYRGYDVRELANQATFEEVAFLLVTGRLPAADERKRFATDLRGAMLAKRDARRMFASIPTGVDEMAVLRTAVSGLGVALPGEARADEAVLLLAQVPALLAARYRIARERPALRPKRTLGFAANVLYLLQGEEPDVQIARAFESALILRADNELNPSAYAVRVAASTGADLVGCVTAGLAVLGGPKHGAHSIHALEMLLEIGDPARADAWIAERMRLEQALPGFGHPVYAAGDPRAPVARSLAELACERAGIPEMFTLALAVEKRVMAAGGPPANVDYWLATLYRAADIPVELFTPVFAVARTAGWIAHALEQRQDAALLRPRAIYVGPESLSYLTPRRRR